MKTIEKDDLSESNIKTMMTESVSYFFSTMIGSDSQLIGEYAPDNPEIQAIEKPSRDHCLLASHIGFTGEATGAVYIYLNENTAFSITKKMLSMDEESLKASGKELIDDCIGEVANMTIGYFKNKLNETGLECALTIPSIIRGKDFEVNTPIKQPNAIRKCYKFQIENNSFIIDLLVCTS